MADTPQPEADENWWRGAVIYQVYPRSFADSNGDGTGDLAGVRSRLPYLAELGVNALWFSPWYPSPMADGGYDVADYRDVEPVFGSLAEAEKLISEAVALGIRTIIDIVPNHISAVHPWFKEALAAGPGSPARERFWFRPGRGEHGELPPNNWPSQFGGPAWTRTTNPDGTPGDWFLNLFDSEQPDLNWNHPEVLAEHEDILRFWFDRGAGGVRIDSAAMVSKDPDLPDLPDPSAGADAVLPAHPYVDRDDLHDIYRDWRRIADSYPGTRILVGEVWLPDAERFARYLRPDEMHTAFNFDFLACPWEPARLRTSIETTLAAHAPVSAPATWVLCNHDVTRTVTRYGRQDTGFDFATKAFGVPTDLELGTRRARAAALLTLALPGSVYLYQGEELGLPEVEDIPTGKLQDPMYLRSEGTNPGRDGCRVPLPWSGDVPPFGFSPAGSAESWLPQPAEWAARTAEIQSADPASMLSLYRAAIRLRKDEPELGGDGPFEWLDSDVEVLAFRRSDRFVCMVNLGEAAVELPAHEELLLTSGPLTESGRVPQDTAVWLRV
ncbi:glycoside hydrolase family 13 protein [Streptomyces sp. NBC_00669]|uniref:glycoside hydrolase family 13 protein n=1 Tax=unclassified Streptomyces TaxID=2593676 RepID=UPI002E312DAB|nr:glycoside hydrolase family 13 protein [Streptomyces sp. NBC_00669]